MSKLVNVYGIYYKSTNELIYIGRTDRSIKIRFYGPGGSSHKARFYNEDNQFEPYISMRKMSKTIDDFEPRLLISKEFDDNSTIKDFDELEISVIQEYLNKGCKLLNKVIDISRSTTWHSEEGQRKHDKEISNIFEYDGEVIYGLSSLVEKINSELDEGEKLTYTVVQKAVLYGYISKANQAKYSHIFDNIKVLKRTYSRKKKVGLS